MYMKRVFLAAAFVSAGLSCLAMAEQPAPPVSTIRVTGNASIASKPDRAEIDVGVVTQNQEASVAAGENAGHLQAVLGALHNALGERVDIKTVSYGLTPILRNQPAGEPTLSGYTATNIVRVTLDDLAKTGAAIDAATRSGANRIQDIRFTLRDPQTVRVQALRQAATQARAEAEVLASALGLKILRVLSVEEAGAPFRPIHPMAFATARVAASTAPTPVEAGTIDVSAAVTLTVEVGT
jgi:uncharacterized protein YggE